MAFGLPIITTNRMGSAHTLVRDGQNGYIIDLDPQQLSERILDLVNDQAKRARFSAKSVDIIQAFTLPKMAQKFLEAIDSSIAMRQRMG